MNALAARDLHVTLGERAVLHDVNVELVDGEVTVIVGPNACGKSTLLRSLARLVKATRGSVLLDGREIARVPTREVARRVGLLPQSATVPGSLSVRALVERGRTPWLGPFRPLDAHDRRMVDEAMESVGIVELADRDVAQLSGGQRQRAWIALALAQETDVLLLDEPTTFLDIAHQIDVLDLVRSLNRRTGRTVAMVLHDMNQAARVADRMVAMRDGRIVADGPPLEVVTPEVMRALFDLEVMVIDDPCRGTPMIVPA